MKSETMIFDNRMAAIKNGIKNAEDNIGHACWVFNKKELLTEEEQKQLKSDLDEIREFLLWLSQQ